MKIVSMGGMDNDFVKLCSELDDFMMSFKDVDKTAYYPYGSHENILVAFVAYRDGIHVGCASYRKQAEGIAELKRVFVREGCRGMGISKKLLEAVENKARGEGFHTMTLDTLLSLTSAVNLYHGFGYKDTAIDGLFVCMSKRLLMVTKVGGNIC